MGGVDKRDVSMEGVVTILSCYSPSNYII
jgi:hypothetical protein